MKRIRSIIITGALLGSVLGVPLAAGADTTLKTIENISADSTSTTVKISWQPVSGVDYYTLTDETGKVLYQGSDTVFSIENLAPNNVYSYYLNGVDSTILDSDNNVTYRSNIVVYTKAVEESSVSAAVSVQPQETGGFESVIATTKDVSLEWSGIPAADEYNVYKDGTLLKTVEQTEFTDHVVASDGEVTYKVEAVVPETVVVEGKETTIDQVYINEVGIKPDYISNEDTVITFAPAGGGDYSKFRFMTFIPQSEVSLDPFGVTGYYEGDNRGFGYSYGDNRTTTPRYRTLQEVNIVFPDKSATYYENTGTTKFYKKRSDGTKYAQNSDRAKMDRSYFNNYQWSNTSVSFNLKLAAANPLVSAAPDIDTEGKITLYKGSGAVTGSTNINIKHDGFPSYEMYRQTGALDPKKLYTHDPIAQKQGLRSLFPPMEFSVNTTK